MNDVFKELNQIARMMGEKKARELGINPAGMSSEELGDAIIAEQHRRAVEKFNSIGRHSGTVKIRLARY